MVGQKVVLKSLKKEMYSQVDLFTIRCPVNEDLEFVKISAYLIPGDESCSPDLRYSQETRR